MEVVEEFLRRARRRKKPKPSSKFVPRKRARVSSLAIVVRKLRLISASSGHGRQVNASIPLNCPCWMSGRASQEGFSSWLSGLAQMYPGRRSEQMLRAIMDISARAICFADRPQARAIRVTSFRRRREDRPSLRFLSQTSAGFFVVGSCRGPFLRPDLPIVDAPRAGAVNAGAQRGSCSP
jgi:hypothetical protein